jgi:hypothetical protein
MTKSFAVAIAISLMLFSLLACQSQQGVTISVSLTGQPNGGETNVGSTLTLLPAVYYRGSQTALVLSYNVLSAPTGGLAIFTPRSSVVTASSAGTTVLASTVSFTVPGTYVVQVVVQETGAGDLSASDQTTFVVLPAVAN